MSERALPPLDLTGSSSQVAQKWRKWKRAFEYYAEGKGLENTRKKTSQLLHFAGMEVQDIFEDIADPNPGADQDPYAVCIRKLDHHFRAEENVPFERHVFRQLAPNEGEAVDKFLVRLRQQARHCNFGTSLDDNLRDQLIEKLTDMELKRKLLETRNITLAEVLEKARASEAARQQMQFMISGASINAVGKKEDRTGDQVENLCYSCGKKGHFSRDLCCPAKGRKCAKCSRYGHFAVCCRGSNRPSPRAGDNRRSVGRQTNHVGVGLEEESFVRCDESNPAFSFAVTEETAEEVCMVSISSEPTMDVSINGIVKEVLIDSGSVSNLIGEEDFQKLRGSGFKGKVEHCSKKLFAYGGNKVDVIGQFEADVSAGHSTVSTNFILVKHGRCILGNATARALGVLHVGPNTAPVTDCNALQDDIVGELKAKYPKVFEGVGKLKDFKLKLHVDPNVPPVAQKLRRVPFALRDKVTAKIEELLREDIIERVEGPTTWASPVVVAPKPSGEIRLCVDMRCANEAIVRERLPIPTVDEVLEELNGSTVFSKLDLRWGFHQIELHEDSRDITTFITHEGLFRYKRLSFGVNAAPEKYQHVIRQAIAGVEGVVNIADDLIVHGKNTSEHDQNLHKLLAKLQEKNLTLRCDKCTFRMNKVVFMGILLSQHGIGPTEEKVRAVKEASRPTSATEVRSFLGLVGFSSRFIQDFATIAEPLRALTRNGATFEWKETQEKAFQKLKEELVGATMLAYFDKTAHTKVIADASPVGLGAVLVQEVGEQSRAVCYASRSLSDTERRYSQTEKEALALVWACERFNLYLNGLPEFDLVTDHQALKTIYGPRSKPSARIERWVLRMQPYKYKVCYVPSRENIADALSRLTKIPASQGYVHDEEYIREVTLQAVPVALRIEEIEEASSQDKELKVVRECLQKDDWSEAPKAFVMVRNELTSVGQVVLRGTRIVIPGNLRKRVLDLAHEGHQGIVKTKERLRSKVWWPGIDQQAERRCRECFGCQMVTKHVPPPPVKPTRLPDTAWQEVALDLLGPMPGGEYLLVVVDYFSRWMEVDVIRSTTSATIIKCLDNHFARYGTPVGLRTDNGPNLVSDEMEKYLEEMGIVHHHTTPLWPRANGEVERENRSLLKAMRVFQAEGKNWRSELNKFLLAYRSTNHTTTGVSPAELFFKRKLTTKLPELQEGDGKQSAVVYQQVRDRDAERKQLAKDYADRRNHAKDRDVNVGDEVLLERKKENKLSPSYESEPYKVTGRHGDQVVLQSPQGVEYKRNLQHVKPLVIPDINGSAEVEPRPPDEAAPPEHVDRPIQEHAPPEVTPENTPRRSGRVTRAPRALADYILY